MGLERECGSGLNRTGQDRNRLDWIGLIRRREQSRAEKRNGKEGRGRGRGVGIELVVPPPLTQYFVHRPFLFFGGGGVSWYGMVFIFFFLSSEF